MKAYVTDTHPIIWFFSKPKLLTEKVRKIFERTEAGELLIYIPVIVIWEISLLLRAKKINLKFPLQIWYQKLLDYKFFVVLPMDGEIIVDYSNLTIGNNEDPFDRFDRLIVSYAMQFDSPLITADDKIRASKLVETVW